MRSRKTTRRIGVPTPDAIEREFEKRRLEKDLLEFLIWIFEVIKKDEFLENWHHREIADTLMKVYRGELTHVIINLPPRYTKTELVIKAFVAWCLAKNPKCKFIHLSYSDDLALDNSSSIKETVLSDEFQRLWPTELKQDSKSKKKWYTREGGGVYATSTGGQITGFGAGGMGEDFEGAILIDDPLKPDDARSDTIRTRINERFNNTIKSRTNSRKTPIIIIMQRLHEDDFSGFLLNGGSEFEWYHLNLPAINEDGPGPQDPRQVGDALWEQKHTVEDLKAMEKTSAMTYAGQYQQRPAPAEGNIIKQAWFKFYYELPQSLYYKIHSWDMAFKKTNQSDYVVGQVWGKDGNDFYLVDLLRERMSFGESLKAVKHLVKRHPDYKACLIEDKANGPAIVSSIRDEISRVIAINPEDSKEARFEAVAPIVEAGQVYLPHPSIAPWVRNFIQELITFPNAANDDQCDSFSQALNWLDRKSSQQFKKIPQEKNKPFSQRKDLTRHRKSRIKINSY